MRENDVRVAGLENDSEGKPIIILKLQGAAALTSLFVCAEGFDELEEWK